MFKRLRELCSHVMWQRSKGIQDNLIHKKNPQVENYSNMKEGVILLYRCMLKEFSA